MLIPRSIVGDDPFARKQRLKREMDWLFSQPSRTTTDVFPVMNVYASQDGIAVTAELPGVSKNSLEVNVHRDTVTVKGERHDEPDGFHSVHRRERGSGAFVRTLSLPFQVDPDRVEAHLAHGVLKLSFQRPESDKPKKLTIQSH